MSVISDSATHHVRPIDFFVILGDATFFDMVAQETNYYVEQVFLEGVGDRYRTVQWKPVTLSELRIFLLLLFHIDKYTTKLLGNRFTH